MEKVQTGTEEKKSIQNSFSVSFMCLAIRRNFEGILKKRYNTEQKHAIKKTLGNTPVSLGNHLGSD